MRLQRERQRRDMGFPRPDGVVAGILYDIDHLHRFDLREETNALGPTTERDERAFARENERAIGSTQWT